MGLSVQEIGELVSGSIALVHSSITHRVCHKVNSLVSANIIRCDTVGTLQSLDTQFQAKRQVGLSGSVFCVI